MGLYAGWQDMGRLVVRGDGGLRLHIGERVSLTRRQKETGIDTSQCIQVGAWQVRSQKR